jgi:uncharacterized protein (DUF2249 family)
MTDLTLASTQADADAAERVEQHHAAMSGQLDTLVQDLLDAVPRGGADVARDRLVRWCRDDLVPHALAEEKTLYGAAAELPALRLLVEAMLAEHRVLVGLVKDLEREPDLLRAAATGWALRQLFAVHLTKENEQVLPALVASPAHSVARLLEGMHDLLGPDHDDQTPRSTTGHSCGCGEQDPAGYPELDARAVPHAIRHSTIFGALDAVRPGGGLVLVAPHDPKPLLAQLGERAPGAFEVSYLERGPEVWRLQLVRG